MTVREHIRDLHLSHAEHYVKLAKFHNALSKSHATIGDAADDDSTKESHHEIADIHKTLADECTSQAEHHTACAKSLSASMKADGDDDLSKRLVPDRVSGIVPDRPSLRAIPRAGQPTLAKSDLDFSRLVDDNYMEG